MRKTNIYGKELTREQIERGAFILGEASSYAQVLKEADDYGKSVKFWAVIEGRHRFLVLERV